MDMKSSSRTWSRAFGSVIIACGLIIVFGSVFASRAGRWLFAFPTYQPASPLQLGIGGSLFVVLGVILFRGATSKANKWYEFPFATCNSTILPST